MLEAIREILHFTNGKTWEDYRADAMLRAAVERKFMLLGEALSRLRRSDAPAAERLPYHRRIIGFRNLLVHEYDRIDDLEAWSAVQTDLLPLRSQIVVLLDEPESEP